MKMLQQKNFEVEVSSFEEKLLCSPSKQNKENSYHSSRKTNEMSDLIKMLNKVEIQTQGILSIHL